MSSIVERTKARLENDTPPKVTQVFETPENEPAEFIVVQPVVEPKTIKQNIPGTPLVGFTIETLANELGVVLEKAMHQAGINSISTDSLGLFSTLGIVPKGFYLVKDEFTNKEFFVLNSSNRLTEIFKSLVKALTSTNSETISFPYFIKNTIEVPMKYNANIEDFEYRSLEVDSLYLTPVEIENLNYKFIKEIQFCERSEQVENSIELLTMQIDREEWQAAPYRV